MHLTAYTGVICSILCGTDSQSCTLTVSLHMASRLICFSALCCFIWRWEGAQQGDLIGPLLFCNSMHPAHYFIIIANIKIHTSMPFIAWFSADHWLCRLNIVPTIVYLFIILTHPRELLPRGKMIMCSFLQRDWKTTDVFIAHDKKK